MNAKLKNHFIKYQAIYFIAGGIVVGVVTTKLLFSKITVNVPVINNIPIINNTISSSVSNGGYMTKFVKNLETGELWETVKEAADSAGVSSSMMSKHINGHTDNISNMHYAIVGLGTAA